MRSVYRCSFLILFFCSPFYSFGQELFPLSEPASTIPQGVFGFRVMGETYKEQSIDRYSLGLRAMYGLTSKFSLWAQTNLTNHHDRVLPSDFVTHSHPTPSSHVYYTNKKQYGKDYPYLLNGVHVYGKYRFLSIDGQQTHFRIAGFGEYSYVKSAHDEAEADLNDNGGYGGGLIVTQLYKRFAASLTTGFIVPSMHDETVNLGGTIAYIPQNTRIQYGQAFTYNLSLGYRLYPKVYTGYNQDNYNLYVEIIGKTYSEAIIYQDGQLIEIRSPSLKSGQYTEGFLGIQRIANSNTRMEFCVGFPVQGKSYVHFYPMFILGVQKYLYNNSVRKSN